MQKSFAVESHLEAILEKMGQGFLAFGAHHGTMQMKEDRVIKHLKKESSLAKSKMFGNTPSKALKIGRFFGARSYT